MKRTVIQHGDLTLTDKVPDSEKIRKMAADKMRTGMTKIKMYLKEPRSSDEMWCIFRVANPWEPPTADEEKAGNRGEQKTKKENGDRDRKQQNFSPGENRGEQKTKKENGVRDRKQQNFSPGEEREGEGRYQNPDSIIASFPCILMHFVHSWYYIYQSLQMFMYQLSRNIIIIFDIYGNSMYSKAQG